MQTDNNTPLSPAESEYMSNVKAYLHEVVGRDVLDQSYYSYIDEWLAWYKGKVKSFHTYNHYNGLSYKSLERASLGLPKLICERWASMLYNDKVTFSLDENEDKEPNEGDQERLKKILDDNNFEVNFAWLIEMYMALGTGATTEYRAADGKVRINFVYAPMIAPLRMEGGEIVDCAFASMIGKDTYYVQVHLKQRDGTYRIQNHVFQKGMGAQKFVDVPSENLQKEYSSPVKLFQIYKPNIKNNLDVFSPFGVSVFGNAIDEIKTADLAFDGFSNELRLGKKKIFLRPGALTYKVVTDAKGNTMNVPIFDENETEFFALPESGTMDDSGQQKLIEESNPDLRTQQLTDGMQTALNCVGQAVGFGLDYFTFKGGTVYTNETQVINTQSDLFRHVRQHEKVLRRSITEMIQALMYLATGAPYTKEITIDFDDSIIEDTAEVKRQAMMEFNAGLIDSVQYYQDVYKMTKKQAIEFADAIQERKAEQAAAEAEEEPPEDEDGPQETAGQQRPPKQKNKPPVGIGPKQPESGDSAKTGTNSRPER